MDESGFDDRRNRDLEVSGLTLGSYSGVPLGALRGVIFSSWNRTSHGMPTVAKLVVSSCVQRQVLGPLKTGRLDGADYNSVRTHPHAPEPGRLHESEFRRFTRLSNECFGRIIVLSVFVSFRVYS